MAPKEFKGLMNYLTRPSEDKKRQKGYFETNDPKEAAREIIKRVIAEVEKKASELEKN